MKTKAKKTGGPAGPPKGPRKKPPKPPLKPKVHKSGAQKRQERRAREAQERAQEAGLSEPSVLDFAGLPAPPLGDPTKAIAWANDGILLCLWQVYRHPKLTSQERWRQAKDLTAVLGMIRDKAETQKLVKQILEQRQGAKDKSGGMTPVKAGSWKKTPRREAPGETGDRPAAPPDRGGGAKPAS